MIMYVKLKNLDLIRITSLEDWGSDRVQWDKRTLRFFINRTPEFNEGLMGRGIRTELLPASTGHSSLHSPPPPGPSTVSYTFYLSDRYCLSSAMWTCFPTVPSVDICKYYLTVIMCSVTFHRMWHSVFVVPSLFGPGCPQNCNSLLHAPEILLTQFCSFIKGAFW